jgi:hypothetical protein
VFALLACFLAYPLASGLLLSLRRCGAAKPRAAGIRATEPVLAMVGDEQPRIPSRHAHGRL